MGAVGALSVTFGDSSPRGRAKSVGGAGDAGNNRRGTWAPPYRPSQSPSVTALPEGEPRGMDGRKRGDGMPSPRLGFLLSLGFAQPMMLPYWSTTTLVPSGGVIA